jgi:hypothetical protein
VHFQYHASGKWNSSESGEHESASPAGFDRLVWIRRTVKSVDNREEDLPPASASVGRGHAEGNPEKVGLECARRIIFVPCVPENQENLVCQVLDIARSNAETLEGTHEIVELALIGV